MIRIHAAAASLLLTFVFAACDAPTTVETAGPAPVTMRISPESDRTILVVWDAPIPIAKGYRLTWSNGSGNDGTLDLSASARSAHITGVVGASELAVSLFARDGETLSPLAAAKWVNAFLPEPPGSIDVERTSESTVSVSWSPSSDAGITSYLIIWSNGYLDGLGMRAVGNASTSAVLEIPQGIDAIRVSIAALRGAQTSRLISTTFGDEPQLFVPENIRAASISATSVSLRWDASLNATSYIVAWRGTTGDTGSTSTEETGVVIPNLRVGSIYTFTVSSMRGTAQSDGASLAWATATRFTTFAGTSDPIRMYEFHSSSPSSISIDPALGGPKAISLGQGGTGKGQLAMYINPADGGPVTAVIVGPLYAISEIPAASDFTKVDTSVYISSSTIATTSLDEWFSLGPLTSMFGPNANISAFEFTTTQLAGQGFFVRTGAAGNYHYARVFLKADGVELLHGTYPNRYVELEVSYQTAANLPFAKHAPRTGVRATMRRQR